MKSPLEAILDPKKDPKSVPNRSQIASEAASKQEQTGRHPKNATAEPQNQIHKRIKDETCYLESLVLFEDAEEFVNKITPSEEEWTEDIIKLNIPGVGEIEVGGTEYTGQYFSADVEPTRTVPRSSIYKFDNFNNRRIIFSRYYD